MKTATIDAISFQGSPEQFRMKIRRVLFIFFCAYMRRKAGLKMFARREPIPLEILRYPWFYGIGSIVSDSRDKSLNILEHSVELSDLRRGGIFLRVIMKPDGLYIFEFSA